MTSTMYYSEDAMDCRRTWMAFHSGERRGAAAGKWAYAAAREREVARRALTRRPRYEAYLAICPTRTGKKKGQQIREESEEIWDRGKGEAPPAKGKAGRQSAARPQSVGKSWPSRSAAPAASPLITTAARTGSCPGRTEDCQVISTHIINLSSLQARVY